MRLAIALVAAVLLSLSVAPLLSSQEDGFTAQWAEVEKLISDRKLTEAAAKMDAILAAARAAGAEEDWTRALVQGAQLLGAQGKFEGAVKLLQERPWPQGAAHQAVLHLFHAQALDVYKQASWRDLGERQRVESREGVGVEQWSARQIDEASRAAWAEAWELREEIGDAPLSRFSLYLQPNSYPKEVRGTLRDALTYLYADHLQGHGLPGREAVAEMAAVLEDLEAWHLAAGRREAALEAALERARRLHLHAGDAEERRRIRDGLRERLERDKDLPWWTMGMATLAELERQSQEPGKLRRAHEIAQACAAAFPKSPGAERCRLLVAEIEAPHLSLASMKNDGLGRRSVLLRHRNLPAAWFRAYAVDLQRLLEQRQDLYSLFSHQEIAGLLKAARPVAEWRVELAPSPDFESQPAWVTPPLERPGFYVVVASSREDFGEGAITEAVTLGLGDLTLVVSSEPDGTVEGLALSGETGEPVEGAEIRLYQQGGRGGKRLAGVAASGKDGAFRLSRQEGSYLLLGRKGEETALVESLYLHRAQQEEATRSALIYTDRAVYRPGQKVLWKVLAFRGRQGQGDFTTLRGETVTVKLFDPNGQEVAARTVKTNPFGTASGEMTLPLGRPLGSWRLESGPAAGYSSIAVEEYKRPAFEVTLDDPAGPLVLGRPARLAGKALYYFGLPVARGTVRWRVTREPVVTWGWRRGMPWEPPKVVASGESPLTPEGTFEIAFTPEGNGDVVWSFSVSAEVADEGGETRDAQRAVRIGRATVEAKIASDAGFLTADRPAALTVTRSDLNGLPRKGEGRWTLHELRQPERALLPAELPPPAHPEEGGEAESVSGDGMSPRWRQYSPEEVLASWEDGRRVAGGEVVHGEGGRAEVPLPALKPGAYRLRYETVDDFGVRVEAWRELVVAGPRTPLALPAFLAAESPSVRVGGTARLLVHSGLPGQAMFLEIHRGGRVAERRRLRAGEGPSVIELPVGPEDRGGFGVKLIVLRDHQLMVLSTRVSVPWDDRALAVSLSRFRDQVRPGAREVFQVTVRAPGGAPVEAAAAELLASMTDRSLDAYAPYLPPDLLKLYPDRAQLQELSHSLGWQGPVYRAWPREEARQVPGFRGDRLRGLDVPREGMVAGNLEVEEGRVTQQVLVTAESPQMDQRAISSSVAAGAAPPPPPPPPPAPAAPPSPGERAPLRTRFDETAFWMPHLLTGPDGTATLEFTVPDSVTSWNVWVHAVSRDLLAGSARAETRSVKDLTVRPALPRFLREGDRAELAVVVGNASASRVAGEVVVDLLDPETGESRLADFGLAPGAARRPFRIEAGESGAVAFPIAVPRRIGPLQVKVTATAGDLADGELREIPVLPSRVHLAQSRHAALDGKDRRSLRFTGGEDGTRISEQLIVTVDGRLFDGVLGALPYLVDYPYECVEQTLNRFVSTGIVSKIFDRYPDVARRAAELAKRETPLEVWDAADPNRKVALEETPFLVASQGGDAGERTVSRILDPRVARAEREAALRKVMEAQRPDGAFPWWPGGPASPYMTVYTLHGLSRAAEAGVELPEQNVRRAWAYLGGWMREECGKDLSKEGCRPLLVFLNYVASSRPALVGDAFPEAERKKVLAASFAGWRDLSGYLRAMLALTLQRMGRPADARLVLDSVMDSARTTPDEGTFWQPEERSWLWYNDRIESHAFALLALSEVKPEDPRRHGLVRWLFLNKQLNHWRSTRATAEVLYALVRYLEKEGKLDTVEEVTVRAAGREETYRFEPEGEARRQWVLPGSETGASVPEVAVEKETPGLVFATATWHFSTENAPEGDKGGLFEVSRRYFLRVQSGEEAVLRPLEEGTALKPGDQVEVHLLLRSRAPAEYVHVRDPRPAGLEPGAALSGWRWSAGIPRYEEVRDSGTNFFFEALPAGELTLRYRLHAATAGVFRVGPATVQSMYAPEFTAHSAGATVRIQGR